MSSDFDADFARLEGDDAGAGGGAAITPLPTPSASERLANLIERPILTLETAAPERPKIEIDGVEYPMRFYEDLAFAEHARVALLKRKADELVALASGDDALSLSDREVVRVNAEIDRLYGQQIRVILPDIPPKVLAKLTHAQKAGIMEAFRMALATCRALAGVAALDARRTGARSSPPSRRASATAGATGGRSRRSATSSRRTAP